MKVHSIRPQKENPDQYWVSLVTEDHVLIHYCSYNYAKGTLIPTRTSVGKHRKAGVDIPVSEYQGIINQCAELVKSGLFGLDERLGSEQDVPAESTKVAAVRPAYRQQGGMWERLDEKWGYVSCLPEDVPKEYR